MIRTYLRLELLEGQSEKLTQLFKQLRILEKAVDQSGCRSAELTVSNDRLRAIVTATWDSVDGYARWTARSDRASQAEQISALLARPIGPETIGGQFTIAHQVFRPARNPRDRKQEKHPDE